MPVPVGTAAAVDIGVLIATVDDDVRGESEDEQIDGDRDESLS
jgi:hypothetical protein